MARRGSALAGVSLRLAGIVLLGVAWAAGMRLSGDAGHVPGMIDYALALIAFTGASAGSVLLLLGAHLFDQVELPQRWTRVPDRRDGGAAPPTQPLRSVPPEPAARAPVADERVPVFGVFG